MAGPAGEYERGRVDATLTEHASHLAKINGSIERFADEVRELTLGIQRLADAADADRTTALATAAALKAAEEARRMKSEEGWTPFQRGLAVLAVLLTAAGVVYAIISAARGIR